MFCVPPRTCRDINDISAKTFLYIVWARSRLENASGVWSAHTKSKHQQLEQVKEVERGATIARFILGRDYSECQRHSKLHLLLLERRREINDLVFFFYVS